MAIIKAGGEFFITMHINRGSSTPMYFQIRELIRNKIIKDEYPYGAEIPTEMELCERFGVSRYTVKQALDGLVREGMLERKKGKGTFVVFNNLLENISADMNVSTKSTLEGALVEQKILDKRAIEVDANLAAVFAISPGESIPYFHCAQLLSEEIIVIENLYINPKWDCDILKNDLDNLGIFRYIKYKNDISFIYSASVFAVLLTAEECRELGCEVGELGLLHVCRCLHNDEVIIYSKRLYRGDRGSLVLEYTIDGNHVDIRTSSMCVSNEDLREKII